MCAVPAGSPPRREASPVGTAQSSRPSPSCSWWPAARTVCCSAARQAQGVPHTHIRDIRALLHIAVAFGGGRFLLGQGVSGDGAERCGRRSRSCRSTPPRGFRPSLLCQSETSAPVPVQPAHARRGQARSTSRRHQALPRRRRLCWEKPATICTSATVENKRHVTNIKDQPFREKRSVLTPGGWPRPGAHGGAVPAAVRGGAFALICEGHPAERGVDFVSCLGSTGVSTGFLSAKAAPRRC